MLGVRHKVHGLLIDGEIREKKFKKIDKSIFYGERHSKASLLKKLIIWKKNYEKICFLRSQGFFLNMSNLNDNLNL